MLIASRGTRDNVTGVRRSTPDTTWARQLPPAQLKPSAICDAWTPDRLFWTADRLRDPVNELANRQSRSLEAGKRRDEGTEIESQKVVKILFP